jgi:3-hydroxybutyryl-CoA dehydratase
MIKNIKIGDSAQLSKVMSEEDVYEFSKISGDFNPVHIDAEAAKNTRFGKRICHGILVASLISAVIGMQLPGQGAIYLEQSLKFVKPVYIGDMVTATVKVMKIEGKILFLETVIVNQDNAEVILGNAKVMLDE